MDQDSYTKITIADKSLCRVLLLRNKKVAAEALISECADGIRGIDYTVEAVSESKHLRDVADQAARLQELTARYATTLAEWVDAVDAAGACIGRMEDGRHASLLAMRYIRGMRWMDICEYLGYSYSRIMALRSEALEEYYDAMTLEERSICQRQ